MNTHSNHEGVERPRLAYLNTRYPALSHTFIQREIEALRADGVDIVPFSIRRPSTAELGEGADTSEIARTVYILDGLFGFLGPVLAALVRSPLGVLRTVLASQRLSPGGVVLRSKHLMYAFEAIKLAGEMKRRGLTTVHVHMANNGAMVALLATSFDRKLTYSLTIHGSAEFFDVFRLRLREKAEGALFVRCISDFCRSQVMAWTSIESWHRLHIVHCGIDPELFVSPSKERGDTLRVLAVGRLVPIKGYPQLIEALRSVGRAGVEWQLRIAGDGPLRESLSSLASESSSTNRVTCLGPLSPAAVREELRQADVLVISSFMEGVPVVLMEAMAAGVPVVATRVGGIAELVEDGETGLLVAPGSAEALTQALLAVSRDEDAAKTRARGARLRVSEQFNIKDVAAGMRALFDRYLE